MRYAGIIKNDIAAAPGVCLSFFVQGCPNHCDGCHNTQTWDFDGGKEFTNESINEIFDGINANGIVRPLCIMGGEPLCSENLLITQLIIQEVKKKYPDIQIYVWTGFLYEDLSKNDNPHMKYILENIDCVIDGPFVKELKDTTLPMRGSSNQRIIFLKKNE